MPETCPMLRGRGPLGFSAPRSHSVPTRRRSLRVVAHDASQAESSARESERSSQASASRGPFSLGPGRACSLLSGHGRTKPASLLPAPLCHPGSRPQSPPSIAGPVGREPRARPAHLMAADAAAKGKSPILVFSDSLLLTWSQISRLGWLRRQTIYEWLPPPNPFWRKRPMAPMHWWLFSIFLFSFPGQSSLVTNSKVAIRGWRDQSEFRALVALPEDLSLVLSIHIRAYC